jgi:hypothetical protein
LHSTQTLGPLLDALGYKVLVCDNFTEIIFDKIQLNSRNKDEHTVEAKRGTVRIGAIVQKTTDSQPNINSLEKYRKRALEKVEHVSARGDFIKSVMAPTIFEGSKT